MRTIQETSEYYRLQTNDETMLWPCRGEPILCPMSGLKQAL